MPKQPKPEDKPATGVPATVQREALAFRDIMELLRTRKAILDDIAGKKKELADLKTQLATTQEAIDEFTQTGEKPATKPEEAKAKNLGLFNGEQADDSSKREYANASH